MWEINTSTVKRDSLFFDRYEYCLRLRVTYSGAIRDLRYDDLASDLNRIDTRIQSRLRMINHQGDKENKYLFAQKHLNALVTTLYNIRDFKLVVGCEVIYVYCNSREQIETILDAMPDRGWRVWPHLSIAKITHQPGTVVVQSSPHKFRSYFRQIVLNDVEREHVRNWLKNQGDAVRMSPGLHNWCYSVKDQDRMYGNYFFDHNEPRLLSMFSLVRPGLIKRTKDIVHR